MNKMRWIKFLGSVLWVFLIPLTSYGQSVICSQRLSEAQRLYDQGRLTEVVQKLEETTQSQGNCLRNGFTKEQKTTAYRLMALVYVFLDNEPKAEDAIVDLLLVDPEHPTDAGSDPAEFIALYNKFRSKPIFRWGVFGGVNQTSAHSLSGYGNFDATQNPDFHFSENPLDTISAVSSISKSFDPGIGLHLGGTIEYMPVNNLEIILRIKMSWQNYKVSYPLITTTNVSAGDFRVVELKEAQQWLSAPLAARYNVPIGRDGNITPYVIGGISFDYMLDSKMTGSREGTTTVSVSNLDLHEFDLREKMNWTSFAGMGVKFSVQRIKSFFIEATYGMGGQNIVKVENRYAAQSLNYNLAHIDNDKSINQVNINVGFIWSVYKPIKYVDKKLARLAQKEEKRRSKKRNE